MTILSQMAENGLQHLEIRLWFLHRTKRTAGDLGFSDNFLRLILHPLNELRVPNFTVMMRNWPQEAGDVRRILREEPAFVMEFFGSKYSPTRFQGSAHTTALQITLVNSRARVPRGS